MDTAAGIGLFSIFPVLIFLVYLVLIGLSVYCIILFIKLARRGIKALDIYIHEKGRPGGGGGGVNPG
ncbi:hypothetical protein [Paenibacillus woosongensis]|uniref:Uncharacterized protein n=1 Tax=Paenibacillus woosongensis TaxID=307580 RepID=A0A7X2Z514_9BACL|nr:hypothetical protein [Paenibacillus woosongensis]MUG47664.1 hypothetical protein [Paenibacillus woosongensis]